jgi:hypothetical protein
MMTRTPALLTRQWKPVFAHVGVSHKPRIDHRLFKAPLTADFESRNPFLRDEPVNGESVDLQIVSDLLNGDESFFHIACLTFLY